MRAMLLETAGGALVERELPIPVPLENEVLIKISACGVCRTDLHLVDRELPKPKLPLIPGHEIVGHAVAVGANVDHLMPGERLGVAWLGFSCGDCKHCLAGQENLCDRAVFTGYQRDGGYAQYTVADARYCYRLPDLNSDTEIAPLLCAGLIGWRSLKLAGDSKKLGIYGFGAAAHIIIQIALWQGRSVFAFTRPGDIDGQKFALGLGASWAGGSDEPSPEPLDAAIIYAPVGALIPQALRAVDKGGKVVCGGIHMSDVPSFPYEILWGERSLSSVANLTRKDATEFLSLLSQVKIKTKVYEYPLSEANKALKDLREGKIKGAAVLTI